jgi:hypothetical protein
VAVPVPALALAATRRWRAKGDLTTDLNGITKVGPPREVACTGGAAI